MVNNELCVNLFVNTFNEAYDQVGDLKRFSP